MGTRPGAADLRLVTGRGFEQVWVSDPAAGWGVAAHRFAGTPVPLEPGARMVTFTRR